MKNAHHFDEIEDAPKPIFYSGRMAFVLFAQQEPHEFRVWHPLIIGFSSFCHTTRENSLNYSGW